MSKNTDITNNILDSLEERADHLPENELSAYTAKSDFFNTIHNSLISRGTKLIAGPRGSGKTHLMRFTYIECKKNKKLPLCVYVSFNRYLRLEPFLKTKADAIELFHCWMLARILLSIYDWINSLEDKIALDLGKKLIGYSIEDLESTISHLERGAPNQLILNREISLSKTIDAIENTASYYNRKRSIILFDDAALTLTPEYMQELFDLIRTIKTSTISPKASVYPGTTEYGPRFHVNHEAELIPVWLAITAPDYSTVMGDIAVNRATDLDTIPEDVIEYIKYAAFGIPRAFLVMLRDFKRRDFRTVQQGLNKIIQNQNIWRISEYESLALKVPKFQSLIEIGKTVFLNLISDLKKANNELLEKENVQLNVGFSDITQPLEQRMMGLLVEAGLLYEHSAVSHGDDRQYLRYTPHIAMLIEQKVFPGSSIRSITDFITRKPAKHPLRRSLRTLFGSKNLTLKLNISPCSICDTPRVSESQKFCHNCGSALIDQSTFERCMDIELQAIPYLTTWQKEKIRELKLHKIGDFSALQDPGTELRKLHMIGSKRASSIINGVAYYVDEFLS